MPRQKKKIKESRPPGPRFVLVAAGLGAAGLFAGFLALRARSDVPLPAPPAFVGEAVPSRPVRSMKPARVPETGSTAAPVAAIVLDDWGYNLRAMPALRQTDAPLTLAVLPGLPYSGRISEEAASSGHEIILHLPMEPKGAVPTEEGTLRVGMTESAVEETIREAFGSVPGASGVSSHQGSRATEDRTLMEAVLRAVKRNEVFFLDSFTTNASVAGAVALEIGVPCLRRDVFLDNVKTPEAIEARVLELLRLAKQNGRAVGIGHDEPMTLEVIRRNLETFKREGVRIVKLSELLEERRGTVSSVERIADRR